MPCDLNCNFLFSFCVKKNDTVGGPQVPVSPPKNPAKKVVADHEVQKLFENAPPSLTARWEKQGPETTGPTSTAGGGKVPLEGVEPPTLSLGRNCSSIELQRLKPTA